MDYLEIAHLVDTDPVVQTLMQLPIPMRLGYVGLDGHPRTVPIIHLWNGKAFVFATPSATYKVKSIAAHPEVAFTLDIGPGRNAAEARVKVTALLGSPIIDYAPLAMVGRGTASIEITPGVPQEHFDGSRRFVEDEAKLEALARIKRDVGDEWAVISIVPTHVTMTDFITRFPPQ
jgi:Pyridoxamine 5'-phosphate oxidase